MDAELEEHAIDDSVVDSWSETVEFAVDRDRTVAYAKATNDPVAAHLDGTYAPPVFAIVPPFALLANATMAAVPDELKFSVLHGEQDIRIVRPIVPGDVLSSRAKVIGITGKPSGVVVTTLSETRDAADELVNEQYFVAFFRGGRWPHSVGVQAPSHAFDIDRPVNSGVGDGDPVVVEQRFDPDQTFRYAEASGDPMPIHLDDDFAKKMGLPGIIIHGLCTMAFTSHAVVSHACPDDPRRLERIAVRFNRTVQPKHTITTTLERVGESGRDRYHFETVNDDGDQVIKDGLAVVAHA